MKLFYDLDLQESEKQSVKEINHAIDVINTIYNEWKKVNRRKNAVDIVMTSVNKFSHISPSVVDRIHDTAKLKLTTILMRCMDTPTWKDINSKKNIYKKIVPLLKKLQNHSPNSESGGNLNEIIMTRLSAILYATDENNKTLVCYEPSITDSYLKYILGEKKPEKVYKMQAFPFPEDFDSLIETLKINHNKAESKFKQQSRIK